MLSVNINYLHFVHITYVGMCAHVCLNAVGIICTSIVVVVVVVVCLVNRINKSRLLSIRSRWKL